MSTLFCSPPSQAKATDFPSGEKLGEVSLPGYCVNGTAFRRQGGNSSCKDHAAAARPMAAAHIAQVRYAGRVRPVWGCDVCQVSRARADSTSRADGLEQASRFSMETIKSSSHAGVSRLATAKGLGSRV